MNLNVKLKAKTLWIPVAIVVISYIIIGLMFSSLFFTNSQESLYAELTKLIETEGKQLKTGLSLLTSSQAPADAFLGLEGEDDGMAKDVASQLKSMGLDGIYFTGLNGHILYPKNANLPEDFIPALGQASKNRGDINIMYFGGKLLGFAPVVDVDTPVGFLVFDINIPEELTSIASAITGGNSNEADMKEHTKVSEHLKSVYNSVQIKSNSFFKKMLFTTIAILSATLLLIIFVLHTTSRNIIQPVKQLLTAFKKQADGDLTQEVHVKSKDEIYQLTETFNATNRKLSEVLLDVTISSDSIAASAAQLAGSSQNITINASDQSSKSEQAAASMEELNSSFVNVAQNTSSAADSAKQAAELAAKGGEVVTDTINGMNRISSSVKESASTVETLGRSSEQIGEIIKVINDIASQTNLLALNAAIEAARAGEQGRGFAVVADEVRKLAERTTAATSEITDMIKGIQEDTGRAITSMQDGTKSVEEGVRLSNQAGEALQQIVDSVKSVTDMMQQIATAAEEQTSTGEEVTANLESMASSAKQTADAVLSSSESTQNLDNLAQQLKQLVSGFKLQNGDSGSGVQHNKTYLEQNIVTAREIS
jgi:methyl-accepting chemotaxis protein